MRLNDKRDQFEQANPLVPAQSFLEEANVIIDGILDTVSQWLVYI